MVDQIFTKIRKLQNPGMQSSLKIFTRNLAMITTKTANLRLCMSTKEKKNINCTSCVELKSQN